MAIRRTGRGFTLIELVVVIAIIIILVGIAVPSMSQFFKGQALETSKRLLQSVGNTARRLSITSRKPHRLVFFQVEETRTKKTTNVAVRLYNVPDEEWVGETYIFPSNVGFAGDSNILADTGLYAYEVLTNDTLPDKDDMDAGGKLFIEFDANGKPRTTGITFQTVPVQDDLEIIDPAWRGRELPANTLADLKLVHRGSRNMCFVYISPSNGRVRGKIVSVTGTLPDTVNK